jgi:hypothetical protein
MYAEMSVWYCITASGSIFHQLLEEKITKPPNKGLEPSANQVINRGLSPLPIK